MSYNVRQLITDICVRAGLPANYIDVAGIDIEATVEGFIVTSEHPAFTYIRSLSEIHFFDPSNYDGTLHFVPRGAAPVREIDDQEVLEEVEEDEELERRDSMSVPRVMHLSYFDLWGGMNADKQTSTRSSFTRNVGEASTSTPVVLTADEAKRVVVISHKLAVEEQRGTYKFSLPDSYIDLTVADIVIYRGERLRLVKVEVDDGFQSYEASFDRASAYLSFEEGLQPIPESEPPDLDPGPTYIEAFDQHLLTSSDDRLGYYVAITGDSTAWTGALVELSYDDGETYDDSLVVRSDAVMGQVITDFGDHPHEYPDEHNTFQVRVYSRDPDMTPATLKEMMNRHNLAMVGDEYLSFGDVEEIDPDNKIWEFGYLLRGRKGTPASAHLAGERFVLLQRAPLFLVPAEPQELGRTLTFRATSLGGDEQTITTFEFNDGLQRERAPAYLDAYREGTDAVITWQGVGRLGGSANTVHGAYFQGYRVTIGTTVIEQLGTTLVAPIPSEPTTITVQQLNAFTGAGPAIEVTV